MTTRIQIYGEEQLASTLTRAAEKLAHLKEADAGAGEMIASSIRGFAPRVTGQLAGSITASGPHVVATAPYAGPQNFGWAARAIVGREFMIEGARAVESSWVALYEKEIQKDLDGIRGI